MRRTFTLFACSLLLASIFSIASFPTNVAAGSPPPPNDGIDGLQYIDGEWNVNGVENYTNETIVLTGNLTVEFGGNLTFNNVTLIMNCTLDGEFHIEVLSGGSFYIYDYDNNNVTTGDASNITAYNTNFEYLFWVREGSNYTMKNSELHECGYDWNPDEERGLFIEADDVLIDHNLIGEGYNGIVSWYANNTTISNSTIENNYRSGIMYYHSNGDVVNNLIREQNGIGGEGITLGYSSILFNGNTIKSNQIGMTIATDSNATVINNTVIANENGINFQWANDVIIKDNNISSNTEDGIYILTSGSTYPQPLIINNTLLGNAHGIVCGSSGNPTIINCTIENTATNDLEAHGESHITTINTTFNKNKVVFDPDTSNLTVKWYLHSHVNDTYGTPISNATVRIQDNSNGTYDQNFTTDPNGYFNWTVLREYYQTQSTLTDYNPYNITVSKSGYVPSYTTINVTESRAITVTLQKGTGDYPPPVNGDWHIWNDTYVGNDTIVLNGNLTIEFGGNLTFKNVTLMMNSTTDGEFHIEVLSGGSFYINDYDNDNTTTGDASKITAYNTNFEYLFWVRAGSNITIKNSELHECGYNAASMDDLGLLLETDNVNLLNNLFSDNYLGILCRPSNATIIGNTIISTQTIGIMVRQSSTVLIADSNISDSWVGIVIDTGANATIINNTVTDNENGINFQFANNVTIKDNNISSNTEDGIYILTSGSTYPQPLIINNTLRGNAHGIVCGSGGKPIIINCTIENTATNDLQAHGESHIITINTTFNKSKVVFDPDTSNLTVKWYLHTYINDTLGNPIPGATVHIKDNANGTYDRNVTTDVNGYVNWTVLREYYQTQSTLIDYNPYNITVSKPGYLTSYADVEMNESKYIIITLQTDENPIADAGPDQSINEDELVNFNGSGSTDDVGILWHNWTFGDGNFDFGTNITTNHTYTNAGTYIVTLNVTDTISQWDEDTCLVFVNNVGPSADAGGNKIGDEGQPILFDASASIDTPSDQSNLIYRWYFGDGDSDTGMNVSHSYADDGNYNATLVVTDDNGFVDSNITTITVNNVAPAIEPVPAQTILEDSFFTLKINATDVPADTLTFSDNTTLFDIDPVTGMIEFTPTNDDVGNHSVNVTVIDDDGGVNYTVLNITVLNTNDAPTIELIGQQSAIEDVEFILQNDANDVDAGDVLTYSLITYPSGMSIDGAGFITWTPTNDDVGTHTITVKVEDAGNLYDTETFTIIVSNVNDAPTIVSNILANATEDVFYMAYIHADDIDAGDTLIYALDTYPVFLSIDPVSGLMFGTPDNDDVGTHNVVVNVTDGDVHVTKTFDLNVVNINDAPIIASNPILTADIGVEYAYEIVASDEDNYVLTYSLAEGPDGMVINGTKIIWTPTNEQQGKTYQVVVEVSDGEAITAQSFIVSVGEIPEGTNYWLPLVLGVVGGLISGITITWLINQRKKEEETEEYKVPIERQE